MDSERNQRFNVSTDSSGVLGTPSHWNKTWGFAGADAAFDGFEVIAWGGNFSVWTNYLLEKAKVFDCRVVGLHGRTGGIHESYTASNRLILAALNQIILPTPTLLSYAGKVDYLLLHGPELRNERLHGMINSKKDTIELLYVENHLRPGADGAALSIARDFRREGVNAGMMFDLFHYVAYKNRNGDFRESWNSTLDQLSWILDQKDSKGESIPVGVHIPMGTLENDSLPIGVMDDAMWKDLGGVLQGASQNIRVVIENQQAGLAQAFPIKLTEQSDRNKRNVDLLRDNGVI